MDKFIISNLEAGASELEIALAIAKAAILETLDEKEAPDCRAGETLVKSILWDHLVHF